LFTLDPSTVTAGRTLSVLCESDTPLKNATLYFNDRKARFFPLSERESRARLGVNSLEPAGPKRAAFYAELPRGRVYQATVTFQVEPGTYPVSRVKLPADRDKLVASGQMERDAAALDRVYREPREEARLWSGVFVLPSTGVFSSVFGARRAYGAREKLNAHTGLDIANDVGTPIHAPNRGRAVFVGRLDSFGGTVVLDHGQGVFSYYLHMVETSVEPGSLVEPGARIGRMGAEGVATGPHLHWSFVVSGERVDPAEWTEREFR
jgi:murein DD-endopeptidase MepM/ murein hydrolase activator NlpD